MPPRPAVGTRLQTPSSARGERRGSVSTALPGPKLLHNPPVPLADQRKRRCRPRLLQTWRPGGAPSASSSTPVADAAAKSSR
eukprot:scaffold2349_cov31-Tisochrysis_lutea.AAC.1